MIKGIGNLNKDEFSKAVEETAMKAFNLLKENKNYKLTFGDYRHPKIGDIFGIALPPKLHFLRKKFLNDVDSKRKRIINELRDDKIKKILN